MLIVDNGEYMPVSEEGFISRQGLVKPSGQWVLLGAARLNNFGYQVEFLPRERLSEIQNWHYKNGKQKWHIVDLDHGTRRMWGGRPHKVIG